MIARTLSLLILLGLSACQPADDGLALQADYLQRLHNAVEGDAVVAFDKMALTQYRLPPRRERLVAIPEIRIGLLDLLLDVRRCPALQQQISQRNSSLGKQLVPSSRLGYEGDLLRTIDACLAHLAAEHEQALHITLSRLALEKRAQLPGVFWNALNASPEVERYLRFADQTLATAPDEDAAALDALAQLAAMANALPQTLPPSTAELDPLFFALHASPQGGQLISSLASLTHTLNEGSRLLEERQQQRPICPLGQATSRGRILQNIFVKYYAGGLQPYLAQVHQRGQSWSSSLRQLSAAAEVPAATRNYLLNLAGPEQSLWVDFLAATARHVRAWQDSLNSCGLAPGQSGWKGEAASANQ
ncbi:DUF3080 family protein [Pseudomonas borbori]|uniref:DUF3080 domain-containing protein n=1 Tax=Pseudomonas borbori TaxID=289003 RepID=A0A1I5PBH1_9PSED|nr:DUF3080 family protein [Pseudomonas borbori]SFP31468.1 Protein of unknown function [Pseudomonas borbori]